MQSGHGDLQAIIEKLDNIFPDLKDPKIVFFRKKTSLRECFATEENEDVKLTFEMLKLVEHYLNRQGTESENVVNKHKASVLLDLTNLLHKSFVSHEQKQFEEAEGD